MSNPAFNLLTGDPTTWGVPAVGRVFLGINTQGQLVIVNHAGVITPLINSVPSIGQQDNAAGNTTVTPTTPNHTEQIDASGAGRDVPVIMDITDVVDGQLCRLLITFPAVSGFYIKIRNATSGGTLLDTFGPSDGGITKIAYTLVVRNGAWQLVTSQAPAY